MILQLRIELLGIEPLIWRRLQIPSDYTFWDLHVAIQSAFAWNDSHLHEFLVPSEAAAEQRFGIPMPDDLDEEPVLPVWDHQINQYLSHAHPRIEYVYDFGDNWRHAVIFEDWLPTLPGKRYPRCTAGERAGPPDDCGGTSGYQDLLETLADPTDSEYAASHVWAASMKGLRGRFDPEAFDEQRVKFANPLPRLKRLLKELYRQ